MAPVQINSEENLAVFRHGLKCFFEKTLASRRFRIPTWWCGISSRANETVYMVMQYVRGRTLQFHPAPPPNSPIASSGACSHIRSMALRRSACEKTPAPWTSSRPISHHHERQTGAAGLGAARRALTIRCTETAAHVHRGLRSTGTIQNMESLGPWTDIYAVGAYLHLHHGHASAATQRRRETNDQMIPARANWQHLVRRTCSTSSVVPEAGSP